MKAVTLAQLVGSTEGRARICSRQRHRENQPSESDAQCWKWTVAIPFLDVICSERKSRFSKEKWAHYELCALIAQVIVSKSEEATVEIGQALHMKWGHLMPSPSSFDSEVFRWMNHWKPGRVRLRIHLGVLAVSETHRENRL